MKGKRCDNKPCRVADGKDDIPDRPGENTDDHGLPDTVLRDENRQQDRHDDNLGDLCNSHDTGDYRIRHTDFIGNKERAVRIK